MASHLRSETPPQDDIALHPREHARIMKVKIRTRAAVRRPLSGGAGGEGGCWDHLSPQPIRGLDLFLEL